jgi:hypothetical protein
LRRAAASLVAMIGLLLATGCVLLDVIGATSARRREKLARRLETADPEIPPVPAGFGRRAPAARQEAI